MESLENGKFNIFEWAKKLDRPLILDGAMGSLLQVKYPSLYHPGIWMNKVLIQHPDFVQNLHLNYINAGADIITTYTFRTSPYALSIYDDEKHSSEEMVKIAVNQCLEARKKAKEGKTPVLIAGSNSSMVHCYAGNLKDIKDEEIIENHTKHIEYLMKAGVDFILNETFSQIKEIEITSQICTKQGIPYIISLYCDENLNLISGEKVLEALEVIKKYNPLAISFNCVKYSTMKKILKEIDLKDLLWGLYINCGDEKMQENYVAMGGKVEMNMLDIVVSPENLVNFTNEIIQTQKLRPSFVGTCCCSNHEHTEKLKANFDKKLNL